MNYYLNTDCLQHHGIKGQRWGVRRYENKDGTLTSKGKERYSKGSKVKKAVKVSLAALAASSIVLTGAYVTNRVLNDIGEDSINSRLASAYLDAKKSVSRTLWVWGH